MSEDSPKIVSLDTSLELAEFPSEAEFTSEAELAAQIPAAAPVVIAAAAATAPSIVSIAPPMPRLEPAAHPATLPAIDTATVTPIIANISREPEPNADFVDDTNRGKLS